MMSVVMRDQAPDRAQQPLAVVDYVPSVAVTLEQAKSNFQRLQAVTKELMQKGVDYDTIPGTPKPTLLKPGAEHLLQFFGLGHKVSRVQAIEDWDNGFFYYCYRVTVFKARMTAEGSVYEQVIAECEGSANSKEKRYRNQDVYTIVNTLQKMAIKRALVGATLQATGTSGMFTQDLDDMDINEEAMHSSPKQQPQTDSRANGSASASQANGDTLRSEKQAGAIMGLLKRKFGCDDADAQQIVEILTGAPLDQLTTKQASALITRLNSLSDGAALEEAVRSAAAKRQSTT